MFMLGLNWIRRREYGEPRYREVTDVISTNLIVDNSEDYTVEELYGVAA